MKYDLRNIGLLLLGEMEQASEGVWLRFVNANVGHALLIRDTEYVWNRRLSLVCEDLKTD